MNLDSLCRETRARQQKLLEEAARGGVKQPVRLKSVVASALLLAAPAVFVLLKPPRRSGRDRGSGGPCQPLDQRASASREKSVRHELEVATISDGHRGDLGFRARRTQQGSGIPARLGRIRSRHPSATAKL